MTVNSLLKEFDEFMAFQNLAAGTRGCYCGHVRKFLRTFRRDPKNISFEEIRDYLLKLKGSKLRDQAKFAIAKFYNEVVKELRPLTSIPNGKRPKYLPKSISPHECYRIFNAIDNVKHRLLIQLIYAGALRVSEPPRIRIRHLNADDKMLFIELSKGAKDRSIPLPDDIWVLMKTYVDRYFKFKKPGKDDFLFEGQQAGEAYSERSIQLILGRAVRKAGILKHVTVHTLRHSRATHLVRFGWDVNTLCDFLGHEDIRTTRIYLHTSKDEMREKMLEADTRMKNLLGDNYKLLKAV